MTHIRVWWSTGPAPGNFGDTLTPILLRYFGFSPVWDAVENADLLCSGSIVRLARPGQLVLGSGLLWSRDMVETRATYLGVRGPLTRAVIVGAGGKCPKVYGDPGLLLPMAYYPTVQKRYDLGVVPHYVDFENAVRGNPGHRMIHPVREDPRSVVDDILQCRAIVSSSLHGIVVAHAYHIPAAWVRFGNGLDGNDVKFRDYGESVGLELVPHRSIEEAVPVLPEPEEYLRGDLVKAFLSLNQRMRERR